MCGERSRTCCQRGHASVLAALALALACTSCANAQGSCKDLLVAANECATLKSKIGCNAEPDSDEVPAFVKGRVLRYYCQQTCGNCSVGQPPSAVVTVSPTVASTVSPPTASGSAAVCNKTELEATVKSLRDEIRQLKLRLLNVSTAYSNHTSDVHLALTGDDHCDSIDSGEDYERSYHVVLSIIMLGAALWSEFLHRVENAIKTVGHTLSTQSLGVVAKELSLIGVFSMSLFAYQDFNGNTVCPKVNLQLQLVHVSCCVPRPVVVVAVVSCRSVTTGLSLCNICVDISVCCSDDLHARLDPSFAVLWQHENSMGCPPAQFGRGSHARCRGQQSWHSQQAHRAPWLVQ